MQVFHIFTDDFPGATESSEHLGVKPPDTRQTALITLVLLFSFLLWQPSVPGVMASEVVSPLAPPLELVRGFRAPLTDYGAGHRGIDMAALDGVDLLAPTDGQIFYAGLVAAKPVLTIATVSGLKVSLEPACASKPVGRRVSAGAVIGVVCGSGYSSHCAPRLCVHFSVRNARGYLSPLYLMGQAAPSRLVR